MSLSKSMKAWVRFFHTYNITIHTELVKKGRVHQTRISLWKNEKDSAEEICFMIAGEQDSLDAYIDLMYTWHYDKILPYITAPDDLI